MDTSNIKPRFRKKVETNHRWKALVGNIHLSDPELRVILELPDHRGTGRDIDIDTLRKYVPTEFEGSPVSDQEAKAVLRAAVDKAFVQVMHRVSSLHTISSYFTPAGHRISVLGWSGEHEPTLPPVLQDIPSIQLEKLEGSPYSSNTQTT